MFERLLQLWSLFALNRPLKLPTLVLIVQLDFKEEAVDEAVRVLSAMAHGARAEPGCARFDVLRDQERPSRLITYEAFASPEAMEEHKARPYVKAWGAFQYGDSKPILKKHIVKHSPVDFESVYETDLRAKL